MSNTTTGAAGGAASYVAEGLAAIKHGAALIYHDVLAAESTVQTWETKNPTVGPLLAKGISFAEDFLSRMGMPVGTISLVVDDMVAALKQMAANDASVPSQPVTGSSVKPAAPPAAQPTA